MTTIPPPTDTVPVDVESMETVLATLVEELTAFDLAITVARTDGITHEQCWRTWGRLVDVLNSASRAATRHRMEAKHADAEQALRIARALSAQVVDEFSVGGAW